MAGNPVDLDYIDTALVKSAKGLRISPRRVGQGVTISPRQFLLEIHRARGMAKTLADFADAADQRNG
jgi:hypothetical protein